MIKFYFKHEDSEICHSETYFQRLMKERGLTEIEVFEAIPEIVGGGIFWCKEHSFCGDNSSDTCGKDTCKDYDPKNRVSGVCKHHAHWLYTHGETTILKLK